MGDLNWTDDQWRKVNDAVTEAFGKASVASAFLPLYGPLSGGAETVRNERCWTPTRLRRATHTRWRSRRGQSETGQPHSQGRAVERTGCATSRCPTRCSPSAEPRTSSRRSRIESSSKAISAEATDSEVRRQYRQVPEGRWRMLEAREAVRRASGRRSRSRRWRTDTPAMNATGVEVVSAVVKAIRRLENSSHSLSVRLRARQQTFRGGATAVVCLRASVRSHHPAPQGTACCARARWTRPDGHRRLARHECRRCRRRHASDSPVPAEKPRTRSSCFASTRASP